jgi:hypothetical protein
VSTNRSSRIVRVSAFEVNSQTGELRQRGQNVRTSPFRCWLFCLNGPEKWLGAPGGTDGCPAVSRRDKVEIENARPAVGEEAVEVEVILPFVRTFPHQDAPEPEFSESAKGEFQ